MDTKKSCKVLVVEDEGLIALDIAGRLEALGHEVVATVGTAREALEKAAGADLVLMDISLDGAMDGVEAAAQIPSATTCQWSSSPVTPTAPRSTALSGPGRSVTSSSPLPLP